MIAMEFAEGRSLRRSSVLPVVIDARQRLQGEGAEGVAFPPGPRLTAPGCLEARVLIAGPRAPGHSGLPQFPPSAHTRMPTMAQPPPASSPPLCSGGDLCFRRLSSMEGAQVHFRLEEE